MKKVSEEFELIHHISNQSKENEQRSAFEWLHICMLHEGAETYLTNTLDLPPLVAAAMVEEDTRSRVLIRPEGMMLLVKAMHQHDGASPEMMVSLRMWIDPKRVITAREKDIDAVVAVHDEIVMGHGLGSTADFAVHIITHIYREFDPLIGAMEAELDALEELATKEETEAICNRLTRLERRAAIFQRHLSPQAIMLDTMLASSTPLISADDKEHLVEQQNMLRGMLEALQDIGNRSEIINDRIQRIEEFKQTQTNYLFAAVATIFLPPTLLTGLFGANVSGIPWMEGSFGFGVLSLVCVLMMASFFIYFKLKKWL